MQGGAVVGVVSIHIRPVRQKEPQHLQVSCKIYTTKEEIYIKGEPQLTDPFNLLINVKLRML